MSEIKWATPIATALTIAESEWKRQLEEARDVFKTWKKVYPRGTELYWSLYSARQGIRSLPAKHIWKNRQNRRMVLEPHDQYRRALTVKTKDRKPVIKMVTPVEQATEMVMAELKRERDLLKSKKKRKPPTRQKPYTIKDWISF